MILTDEEVGVIHDDDAVRTRFELARAIEAAVIAKLAAGVGVEPVALLRTKGEVRAIPNDDAYDLEEADYKLFTLDQLQQAIAAARVQAIHANQTFLSLRMNLLME